MSQVPRASSRIGDPDRDPPPATNPDLNCCACAVSDSVGDWCGRERARGWGIEQKVSSEATRYSLQSLHVRSHVTLAIMYFLRKYHNTTHAGHTPHTKGGHNWDGGWGHHGGWGMGGGVPQWTRHTRSMFFLFGSQPLYAVL
jgi:hypothetical protein